MNKTIKIIDLLNKIANGEEAPHIEYDDIECYLGADGYLKDNYGENVEWWIDRKWLNKEVEIIEDNDKLEKININDNGTLGFPNGCWTARNIDKAFAIRINKIIDRINKIEEKLDEK